MIFLSASIPDPRRDEKYISTADPIAIRDAVRALATVVIPHSHLVWGGHPAITPLILQVLTSVHFQNDDLLATSVSALRKVEYPNHITLYQSEYFTKDFPTENRSFQKIVLTPARSTRQESIHAMRMRMLKEDHNSFTAGIFIGGMEGVEEEFELFVKYHPNIPVYPVASTGAAARILYDRLPPEKKNARLMNDYAFMDLFRSFLKPNSNSPNE